MKRLNLTLTVLGAVALGHTAFSYTTLGASWPSWPFSMSAAAISFPAGNQYRTDLGTISSRFSAENPSNIYVSQSYDDASVAMDNNQNEIWFSSDTSFSPAVTFYWSSGSTLTEADIIAYNGLAWTTSSSKTATIAYGGSSRYWLATALHEYGHAAGLGHENLEYNIMGQDWDHVSCNGSTIRTYLGEDAADGLVSVYGVYSGMIEDVGVSYFKYQGTSGAYSAHEPCEMYDSAGSVLPGSTFVSGQRRYDVSPGQQVRVEFTFENNGASSQTTGLSYYVSTNNFISTGDRLIGSGLITQGRADVFTRYDTITIPTDLNTNQTYYLGVMIDDADAVSEATEVNNYAYHAFQVTCDATATVNFFNSGTNPASLTAGGLFRVGQPWSLAVNLTTTGHTFGLPFGFDTPFTLALAGGQTLLCIDGGSGEVLALSSKTGPVAVWNGTVPNLSILCGFFFSAQAIHFGGPVPFALSNAQDINIGR